MTKIIALMLCLISAPIFAQTQSPPVDEASAKKIAKELFVCSSFFELVSFCFTDKNVESGPQSQAKMRAADLARAYKNQAVKARNNAAQFAASTNMPLDELLSVAENSKKGWMAEINMDCGKIGNLSNKNLPACKRLVEHLDFRLKELSECPHEGKEGC